MGYPCEASNQNYSQSRFDNRTNPKQSGKEIGKIIGALGVIFFVSIATTFAALHSDLRCSRLEKEVALLHEKAIRMREARHESDSHTAIVRQLSKRGIEMIDPHSQPRIIEN